MENNLEIKSFAFEAWYRHGFCASEKDFWEGVVEATDLESAEEKIKQRNRNVFKIIWK